MRSFPSRWMKFSLLLLPLAFCAPLAGCGETPAPPQGPTAEDDALRQQMLEYDKAHHLSAQAKKRR